MRPHIVCREKTAPGSGRLIKEKLYRQRRGNWLSSVPAMIWHLSWNGIRNWKSKICCLRQRSIISLAAITDVPWRWGIHSYISVTGFLLFLDGPEKRSRQYLIINLTICCIRMTGIFQQIIPPVFLIHASMDLRRIRFTGCLERTAITGSQMPQHWWNQVIRPSSREILQILRTLLRQKKKRKRNWKTVTGSWTNVTGYYQLYPGIIQRYFCVI